MMSIAVHPIVNRDREEIRVPSPIGPQLLDYLKNRGLRGNVRSDRAGDVIALEGEPEMCRVVAVLADWEKQSSQNRHG